MASLAGSADLSRARPTVHGKYFFIGKQKIYLRGVSYGPFSSQYGDELGNFTTVATDLQRMKALNINCLRTYTVPEQWFLDLCRDYGLRVLVGIPWPQHVAFLDDSHLVKSIESAVVSAIRKHHGHSSVLGYAIGSEIPASIVRWHGTRKIERFLHRLYVKAKTEDPDTLVTYANYPTTEYLHTPFLDFVSFNIYLESRNALQRYLYRLQNISGDMPLLISEFGLDSARNGEELQAEVLNWQIKDVFAAGCAGGFIFSWTDEWHRGGEPVENWKFGITTRDRRPKKAIESVNSAFVEIPFGRAEIWPGVSVVVCVRNGQKTIDQCLRTLADLDYPNYEVIVVDDGSQDNTAAIIAEYEGNPKFRLFRTASRGLSMARNLGIEHAVGEIVAFIDSDAYPDRDWLRYFAADFVRSDFSALGGPNIPYLDGNRISPCVAASPGWPTHVLVSDRDAEHIPGCNMAFRKSVLKTIGGFDPQFRTAGDDVDICWRMAEKGYSIGFCHGAVVWHYPRGTVRSYWTQQKGYGAAEALLERKWPEKYHGPGQIVWAGRIYNGHTRRTGNWRIYHGLLGMSPFQSVYCPRTGESPLPVLVPLFNWLTSKEWNMTAGLLILLSLISPLWHPLSVCVLLVALRAGFQMWDAFAAGRAHSRRKEHPTLKKKWAFISTTTLLHLIQPIARSLGRLNHTVRGMYAPPFPASLPSCRTAMIWNEKWQRPEALLRQIESRLSDENAVVVHGEGFNLWDLQVQTGIAGAVRIRMAFEDHEKGKQLVRVRCWPYWQRPVMVATFCMSLLAVLSAVDGSYLASLVLGLVAAALAARAVLDSASATALLLKTVRSNAGRHG